MTEWRFKSKYLIIIIFQATKSYEKIISRCAWKRDEIRANETLGGVISSDINYRPAYCIL